MRRVRRRDGELFRRCGGAIEGGPGQVARRHTIEFLDAYSLGKSRPQGHERCLALRGRGNSKPSSGWSLGGSLTYLWTGLCWIVDVYFRDEPFRKWWVDKAPTVLSMRISTLQ